LLENVALKHGESYVRTKTFGTEYTPSLICLPGLDIVFAVHLPETLCRILCHYDFKPAQQVTHDEIISDGIGRFHLFMQ
jgi:hypothetical protein